MELNNVLRLIRSIILATENAEITIKTDDKDQVTKIIIPLTNVRLSYVEAIVPILHRRHFYADFDDEMNLVIEDKPEEKNMD